MESRKENRKLYPPATIKSLLHELNWTFKGNKARFLKRIQGFVIFKHMISELHNRSSVITREDKHLLGYMSEGTYIIRLLDSTDSAAHCLHLCRPAVLSILNQPD